MSLKLPVVEIGTNPTSQYFRVSHQHIKGKNRADDSALIFNTTIDFHMQTWYGHSGKSFWCQKLPIHQYYNTDGDSIAKLDTLQLTHVTYPDMLLLIQH